MSETSETKYVVMTASAKMPSSCMGRYARVAVVEIVAGSDPKIISERCKDVVKIVQTWERLNVGKTKKSAYHRALREAETLCAVLNDDPPPICPGCGEPAHATESDDENYHEGCRLKEVAS